ncbi:putative Pyridoxamine 5'-phosphate oxidase-domain-containing protein [Seiridium cardinale]|uniref:Pyridoxamine 5'-phosphate oxidase-domain-containing protein n=1 Tax=Seiridium cardinale TaxID=138064 RepID=A0ABR2XS64_9PEZI
MSSSSSNPAAPWRSLFLEHVESMKSPEFNLSTIRRVPNSSSAAKYGIKGGDGFTHIPRARTCVFRGMWAGLPVNPKNDAPLNAELFDSDLLTFTTDVRMDKMPELWDGVPAQPDKDGKTGGDDGGKLEGSGGGGPVEAVFWADGPMVQWRVRGRAYVLGPDVEDSKAGKETQDLLRARMRKRDSQHATGQEGDWSWGREVTAHFGNLSPGMRGSFKNPPPGKPVNLPVDGGLELGQKVTNLDDEIARRNFRVVVIVPEEVDRCDLSDPTRGRRWIYRFVGSGGGEPEYPGGHIEHGWEKVETWP